MTSENSDSRTSTTARWSGQRMGGRILPSLEHFSTQQTSPPVATGNISQRSSFIADGSTTSESLSCRGGQPWPAQFSQTPLRGRGGSSQASLTEPCITGVMSQPLTEGLGCATLTSTVPTLTQRNPCSLPVSGGSAFLCVAPCGAPPLLPLAVRMAFSLDQGLQLDSLWSSGDLHLENSLEDHGVSGQLVLDTIAFEISVWQRCRALTAHQLLRRREGVGILGDIAPSQEAFFLSLQLPTHTTCWALPTLAHRLPADVMRSGALLVAAGFAQCPLAPNTTPSRLGCSAWFVTGLLWVCLLHAGVRWG